MKRIGMLVVGCALAASAGAQSNYFQGVTPRPPDAYPFQASLIATRDAPAGGSGNLYPALYTHVSTDPNTRSLEWANLTVLNNRSNYGSNVAMYGQANKRGAGATWAAVFESQDIHGTGPTWGVEIDAFANGPSRFDETGGGERIALGIVLGRARDTTPKATIDYGVWVLPDGMSDANADVNFGVMVSAQCRYACFAMRAGNKLAWEESAQIASKFDPATGMWGLYNGENPVLQINVATGELRINGRAVKVEFQ